METGNIFDTLMGYERGKGVAQAEANAEEAAEIAKLPQSEQLIRRIENAGFNMDGLGPILRGKGNMQIVSCAGSGKTTGLTFKVLVDYVTGELSEPKEINGQMYRVMQPVWISTFLRSGAEDLKRTLLKRAREFNVPVMESHLRFSTLHAEFKSVLDSLGIDTDVIDAKTNTKLLKETLQTYSVAGGRLNNEVVREIESALEYSRNRIGGSRYDPDAYTEHNMPPAIVEAVLSDWQVKRYSYGKKDFGDFQDILYKFAVVDANQEVIDAIQRRYKFLYVDEFQDTSEVQYAILKVYAAAAKKIVVIGDDDQTIYTWRGSSNEIIIKEFGSDFSPTRLNLEVNYRCPTNILNPIIPSIEKNKQRLEKSIKAAAEGGQMRVGTALSYKDMVALLSQGIAEDVAKGMSVAILCRNNVDGLIPALLLDKFSDGLQYSISGDRMTLESYAGQQVMGILHLFTSRNNTFVEKAIGQVVYNKGQVRDMINFLKTSKESIWTVDMNDVRHSIPSLAPYLERWRKTRDEQGIMSALWFVLEDFKYNVYKKHTNYNEICRGIIDAIQALIQGAEYESPKDVLMDLEDINERLKARKKLSKVGVQIATVHEFKGKEADSVYVWNDSEGVYPTGEASSLSDSEYEEERRVHYIACTRALKKSTIIFRSGKPGVFLQEMDLSNAEKFNSASLRGRL